MISVIIVLYKTPLSKILNLRNYKNFTLYIFEQEGSEKKKKIIQNNLNFKFHYFFSKRNIGLPKAVNFLINKVNTKYCLMTEPDIEIDNESVNSLKKIIRKNNNYIIVGPKYLTKKKIFKSIKKINYKIVNFIDPSCILFNVRLIKEVKFYDEDFYFYWEDIDLMKRINKTKYKIIELKNIFAIHKYSTSSTNSFKVKLLKNINFKFGELLFDYKHKKIRIIKIVRQFLQNLIFSIFDIFFNQKNLLRSLGYFFGVTKFIFFMVKKFVYYCFNLKIFNF